MLHCMKSNTIPREASMSRRFHSPLRPPERLRYGAANEAPPAQGERVTLRDGRELTLRPIHPNDVAALQQGFSHLSAEEVRLRFLHAMNGLAPELAERLCRIDPDSEIAYVLVDPNDAEPEIHGVARAHIDAVTASAEFAVIVQKDFTRQGLGRLLLERLGNACRARGVHELWGDVLSENTQMLDLCNELGMQHRSLPHEPGLVRVSLVL
jgi:acetyltransferase